MIPTRSSAMRWAVRPSERTDRGRHHGQDHGHAANEELQAERAWPTLSELRRRIGANLSDEEFLLRATMPAEHGRRHAGRGPRPAGYDPSARPRWWS